MTREEARDILVLIGSSNLLQVIEAGGPVEAAGIKSDVLDNYRAFGRGLVGEPTRTLSQLTLGEFEKSVDRLEDNVIEALNTLFHNEEGDSGLDSFRPGGRYG